MPYQCWTPAFYGSHEQLRWRIEPGKVTVWVEHDGISTDYVQMDRLAARDMLQDILRELDKQS